MDGEGVMEPPKVKNWGLKDTVFKGYWNYREKLIFCFHEMSASPGW